MDQNFRTYQVGQADCRLAGHAEGMQFDLDSGGGILAVYFNRPTDEEVRQFASGVTFELRLTEAEGLLMLTAKFGSLPWMDAPYDPHLSRGLAELAWPDDRHGLALTVVLVDAADGTVKAIRLLGLSPLFTDRLYRAVLEHQELPFDPAEYRRRVEGVYRRYSSKGLAAQSMIFCKMNA